MGASRRRRRAPLRSSPEPAPLCKPPHGRLGKGRWRGSDGVTMARVTLYTTCFCPYCTMAKRLLGEKGVAFEEIDVGGNLALRQEMTRKANGRRSVPQIWIGETHVGGCSELYQLDATGALAALLAG